MKATRQIDIYLTKKSNVRLIDVVQYDTGIHLVFTVKDFDIPSGATAKLYVQKPSGKFVFQEDGITIADNTILIDLENQAITEHGKVPYQVSIVSGSDMITTFTGLMMVEKSLKDAGAIESKTVIRAFDEAVSDHVAEFQAKAEQIVQACIATIPEDYTVMEAKVNELASAVKGNLSGAVVVADDVSPVEHQPNVWVHGKNLFNYDAWKGIDAIHGDITYSDNGVVKLTATEDDCFTNYGIFPIAARIPVKAGEAVTLSWETDADETLTSGLVYVFANGTADHFKSTTATQKKLTFIPPAGCEFITFRLGVSIPGDSITYWNIQVEKGDTATDYVSYIDPATVTVKRTSKNLIDRELMQSSATLNGVTITRSGDQINLNGTLTVDSVLFNTHFCYHGGLGSYYTLSYKYMGGTVTGTASVCVGDSETVDSARQSWANVKMQNSDNALFYPMTKPFIKDLWFYAMAGVVFNNYKIKIQLEPGKEATGFETCNGTEYTPAADGTISDLTSISPNMTILTDTAGAIVECEYNIDTKTYIDRKISEILKGSI